MRELNENQRKFVAEYLVDGNGKQAAIRAGYTENSAEVTASKLLRNPKVAAALKEQREIQEKRTLITADKAIVTADRILQELLRVATADLRLAFNEDGSLKPIHEIPEDVARAISGVEVEEDVIPGPEGAESAILKIKTKKVKFWDKNKSLELLGKHLKLFTDRIEVEDVTPLSDRMKQARERARAAKIKAK